MKSYVKENLIMETSDDDVLLFYVDYYSKVNKGRI